MASFEGLSMPPDDHDFRRICPGFMRRAVSVLNAEEFRTMPEIFTEDFDRATAMVNGTSEEAQQLFDDDHQRLSRDLDEIERGEL